MQSAKLDATLPTWNTTDIKTPDAAGKRGLPEVAQEFEAVLIGQLLKSMRESTGSGWLGTGEDASSASMSDYAEQMVAGVLARSGGLGLAGLITKGLEQKIASQSADAPSTRES